MENLKYLSTVTTFINILLWKVFSHIAHKYAFNAYIVVEKKWIRKKTLLSYVENHVDNV